MSFKGSLTKKAKKAASKAVDDSGVKDKVVKAAKESELGKQIEKKVEEKKKEVTKKVAKEAFKKALKG